MKMTSCDYKQLICVDSSCYKANKRITPRGILIHGTAANNAKLGRWVKTDNENEIAVNPNKNWFGSMVNEIIPHATIGVKDGHNANNKDLALVQLLPYDMRCWGCGSGKYGSYNDSHIQIEMCQDVSRGKEYLEKILTSTAEWCAELMMEFDNITINDIVSHKEAHALGYASNHGDPENWLDLYGITMSDFRKRVEVWYLQKMEERTPQTLYRVQVGAFQSKQFAEDYAKSLREKYGIECFVIKGAKK